MKLKAKVRGRMVNFIIAVESLQVIGSSMLTVMLRMSCKALLIYPQSCVLCFQMSFRGLCTVAVALSVLGKSTPCLEEKVMTKR